MLLIDFCAFPFNPLLRLHIVYIFLAISLTRILINCGTDWEVPLNVAVLGHKLIKGLGSAKAVFFFHCAYNKCRLINVKSIFYWYQLLSNIGLSSESRLNYLLIGWHQLTPSKSIRDISLDNYNVRRVYMRATKMASLSIPHSNFLFLGQFQYWSTLLLCTTIKGLQGEQGRRSGETTRLPPMLPGVNSRRRRHLCGSSLFLVLSLAPRSFSPGTPVFPSPQKPTFPNFNSTRNQVDGEPLCGCATCKSLSLLFIIIIIIIKLVFSQTLRLAHRQVLHLHASPTTYTS